MEKWTRTFLKRLQQELSPYCEEGYYLEAEGENPEMLRQIFVTGRELSLSVLMDMAVFVMEDESCLLEEARSVFPHTRLAQETLCVQVGETFFQA